MSHPSADKSQTSPHKSSLRDDLGQAKVETAPDTLRHLGTKRARTGDGSPDKTKARFVAPAPSLGKRPRVDEHDDDEVQFVKRSRATQPPLNGSTRASLERLRAKEWIIHDMREELIDHPELLARLDAKMKHYAIPSNVPAVWPDTAPAMRTVKRRVSSSDSSAMPQKRRRTDTEDAMDLDAQPEASPAGLGHSPGGTSNLGFGVYAKAGPARFATPSQSTSRPSQPVSPLTPQGAAVPQGPPLAPSREPEDAKKPAVMRPSKSAFAAFVGDGPATFAREDPRLKSMAAQRAEDFEAHMRNGNVAMDEKRYGQAVTDFEQALKRNTESPEGRSRLALASLRNGQADTALRWANTLVCELETASTDVLVDLGTVLLACSETKLAATVFERLLSRDPANDAAAKGIIECDRLKAFTTELAALLLTKSFSTVIERVDKALLTLIRPPPEWIIKRFAAILEIRPLDFKKARDAADDLDKRNLFHSEALYLRGRFELMDGKDPVAKALFQRALNINDSHHATKQALEMLRIADKAHLTFSQRLYAIAATEYTKVINGGCGTPSYYYLRATSRQMSGDYRGAIRDCQKALNIQADYHRALRRHACCEWHIGLDQSRLKEWSAAVEHLNDAITLFKKAIHAEAKLVDRSSRNEGWRTEVAEEMQKVIADLGAAVASQQRQEQAAREEERRREDARRRAREESYRQRQRQHFESYADDFFESFFGNTRSSTKSESRRGQRSSPDRAADLKNATFYKMLGLPVGATIDEIKLAFRQISLSHHPDKGGNVATYQEIVNARDILLAALQS